MSWILLTIWLKAVDPLAKPVKILLRDMLLNRPKAVSILSLLGINVCSGSCNFMSSVEQP